MIALLLTSEDKLLRSQNDDYNSAMTVDTVNLLKKLQENQASKTLWMVIKNRIKYFILPNNMFLYVIRTYLQFHVFLLRNETPF